MKILRAQDATDQDLPRDGTYTGRKTGYAVTFSATTVGGVPAEFTYESTVGIRGMNAVVSVFISRGRASDEKGVS